MQRDPKDAGILAALMIRLQEDRLPRAKRLLERVNRGETLRDSDLHFLHTAFDESRDIRPLVARNPDYLPLASRVVDLYSEIVSKSLDNERNGGAQGSE